MRKILLIENLLIFIKTIIYLNMSKLTRTPCKHLFLMLLTLFVSLTTLLGCGGGEVTGTSSSAESNTFPGEGILLSGEGVAIQRLSTDELVPNAVTLILNADGTFLGTTTGDGEDSPANITGTFTFTPDPIFSSARLILEFDNFEVFDSTDDNSFEIFNSRMDITLSILSIENFTGTYSGTASTNTRLLGSTDNGFARQTNVAGIFQRR